MQAGRSPPQSNGDYLSIHYWDARFAEEEEYEWCKGYASFRDLIRAHVKPTDKVLIVGNGNSLLPFEMYKDGFKLLMSTDLSSVAVDRMRTRALKAGLPGIEWRVADMLQLPFEDASFDVVLEKGAMDVLEVDQRDPWAPEPAVVERIHTMLASIHRVLTQRGVFLSITFAQPHFRRPLFEAPPFSWRMCYSTFGDGFHYFFYHLYKGTRDPDEAEDAASVQAPRAVQKFAMEHENMDSEDCLLHIAVDLRDS